MISAAPGCAYEFLKQAAWQDWWLGAKQAAQTHSDLVASGFLYTTFLVSRRTLFPGLKAARDHDEMLGA